MSSGGQGSTTQTTQQSLPPWLTDAAQGYLGAAGQVAQLPFQPYQNQRVANLSPLQSSAIQGFADLGTGNQSMQSAGNMLDNTLNGAYFGGNPAQQVSAGSNPYIGNNPYFQQTQQGALNDITHAYQTAVQPQIAHDFTMSGTYGGSAYQTAQSNAERELAQQLGRTASGMSSDQYNRSAQLADSGLGRDLNAQTTNANLGSQAYENERQRQLSAVGASTGLYNSQQQGLNNQLNAGNVERNQNQSLLDSQYQDYQNYLNYPAQQLGIFGSALSPLFGGAPRDTTTNNQLPPADRVSQGLGIAALGNYLGRSGSGGSGK